MLIIDSTETLRPFDTYFADILSELEGKEKLIHGHAERATMGMTKGTPGTRSGMSYC